MGKYPRNSLIFNMGAGNPADSAGQLVKVLQELQGNDICVEVALVEGSRDIEEMARGLVAGRSRRLIVCGGDGTIGAAAAALLGTRATLGIIPTGKRNNFARSLGIPVDDIEAAAHVLRTGTELQVDVGEMRHASKSQTFLEAGVVGLGTSLYPSADELQRGNLGKLGEFISTLVSAEPSEFRIRLDGKSPEVLARAHMVVVANAPFVGANFQLGPDIRLDDGMLDVFVYSDMSKKDLIGKALSDADAKLDERIQRYRARRVEIETDPPMAASADGTEVGQGRVTIELLPRQLTVIAGPSEALVAGGGGDTATAAADA